MHFLGDFSNEEVVQYLGSKFNTVNPRVMVLAKSVFLHAALIKFDGINFILNAAGSTIELAFSEVDTEKLFPIIEALKSWNRFSKDKRPFIVQLDQENTRSLLFEAGCQGRSEFRNYFAKYDVKIIEF